MQVNLCKTLSGDYRAQFCDKFLSFYFQLFKRSDKMPTVITYANNFVKELYEKVKTKTAY